MKLQGITKLATYITHWHAPGMTQHQEQEASNFSVINNQKWLYEAEY